jgi:hypothetical protein
VCACKGKNGSNLKDARACPVSRIRVRVRQQNQSKSKSKKKKGKQNKNIKIPKIPKRIIRKPAVSGCQDYPSVRQSVPTSLESKNFAFYAQMLFLSRLDPLRPMFFCHESGKRPKPPTSTGGRRQAASNPKGRQAGRQPPYIFYAERREFLEKRFPPSPLFLLTLIHTHPSPRLPFRS